MKNRFIKTTGFLKIMASGFAFAIILTVFSAPKTTLAFNLLDPFNLFGNDNQSTTNYTSYTNNTNSVVNSPGGSVNISQTKQTNYSNGGTQYNSASSQAVTSRSSTPTYTSYNNYAVSTVQSSSNNGGEYYCMSALGCTTPRPTPTPTPAPRPTPTPHPAPTPAPVYISYNNYARSTNYDHYNYDDYNDYYDYDRPLYVSCYANTSSADVDDKITWRASVSGGNGSYRYSWEGTNNLDGSGSSVTKRYSTPGVKYASLEVRSGGRTVTANCGSVGIYDDYNYSYNNNGYYSYNNYAQNYVAPQNYAGLTAACYPNTNSTNIGKSVNWVVEAAGGNGVYSYVWSGTDNLAGYSQTLPFSYYSLGLKSAQVTVSSGGYTGTFICGGSISINQASVSNNTAYKAPAKTVAKVTKPAKETVEEDDSDKSLTAASLFSVDNIPWGWVFILVIFVLILIIAYLVAQKNKK